MNYSLKKQTLVLEQLSLDDYSPANNLLSGKIIIVTGAGDGIGKAAALSFANYGATVILMGRTVSKLEAVYDEIEQTGGAQPAIFPIDFEGATEEDYENLKTAIENEFGHIDGLLHNAAILGPRTPLSHYDTTSWKSVLQVNTTAPFLLTKALIPLLEKAKNSSVIFTGSSVGYVGRAFWGAYSVSKAAQENMMQIFSAELDETTPIRLNSINPGATRTNMRANAYPGEDPQTLKTAEEIMPTYLFLMGDDSIGINGKQFIAQS